MSTDDTDKESSDLEATACTSTSSAGMELSKPWTEVVKLGEQIRAELGRAGGDSILARWMTHRIAELMSQVENAADDAQREAVRRECTDLILRLWALRYGHPDISPLSKVVPVLQQLIPQPSYFRQVPRPPARTWVEALNRLRSLQQEELRVCWDAIILRIDQRELAAELGRSEPLLAEMDADENKTYELLQWLDREAASLGELRDVVSSRFFDREFPDTLAVQ